MAAVLKRQTVRSAGPALVDRQAMARSAAPAARAGSSAAAKARAAIVEHRDTSVLIEVICPCGQKTYLECELAETDAAAPAEAR